jgi:translation elongation factor EF-4
MLVTWYLKEETKEVKVGDTLTDANPTTNIITGFEDVKPMVLLEFIQ